MPILSINPSTGKTLRHFDALTSEQLEAKLALAATAWKAYQEVPLEHRALCMRKLASLIEDETEELARLMTLEMGKPIRAARAEAQKCATACRFYAENAAKFLTSEAVPTEASSSYVRFDPLGVVLAVMPWNFPLWQVFRFLAPALMAGNAGLLKHASNVPQCALTIEALTRRAGFPRGVFQALLIESSDVAKVIDDPRVAAITLTGSNPAGSAVAAQAGKLIKKTVLELGGSDPFIVMPSADLNVAIETAIKARTINNGQSCIAAKRFIVHESIYNEFQERFSVGMDNLKVGDPLLDETDVGPLATSKGLEEIQAQVQACLDAGALLITGGERMMVDQGNYFEPTVIAGLSRTAPVYREEIFGPVALLFRVHSVDEAIEVANDTPFGLGASAWTHDPVEQQRFVADLQAGSVFINAMVASDPRLPFGGVKQSGFGRELSAVGMHEFMNRKTVVVA
jgi:succinate-semialdehyde dehydrogenase/glutarate-semialdehyde dehydrogenase